MKKIIFVSNVDSGGGMSGGTRIYVEFLKNWSSLFDISFFGSLGTIKFLQRENIKKINFIETDKRDLPDLYSIVGVFSHFLRRLIKGLRAIRKNFHIIKQADYIYSVSDFYPDFWPAFYAKVKNKKIKWIAGYYLFAPSPFSKESPYKGKNRLRGFLYWLMQRPSYFIAKRWADFVFVTSEPDVKKFITKKRDRSKIIVVQGGVDIAESEKYLKSENIIPVEKRKYDACFVGRFHYQKGVLELVDIWKKVLEKKVDAKLAMIGDGGLEQDVREKIKKYKLEDNIDLLGFMDGQEKYEIFKQSKMMLHPATYDSGGMAAAEGMAWGLPGASFDLEALKTYYPKGMIKTEVNNIKKFAENILRLLDDHNFYNKISCEAHDLIIEVWDWKKRAENIFNLTFNFEKGEKCALCGGQKTKRIFVARNKHGRHMLDAKDKFDIFSCLECGSVFLKKMDINEEYYKKYYESGYYENQKISRILDKAVGLLVNFSLKRKQKIIINNFRNKKRKISILDIGCGNGGFLSSLKNDKFDKSGVEINQEAAKVCEKKGINVYNQNLIDIDFGDKKFNVITMWHVLEHITNPIDYFHKIRDILDDEGVVILQTPNSNSIGSICGGKNWFHLDSPRHLILYNKKSVDWLYRKTGFRIRKIKNEFYDYPLDLFWSVKASRLKFAIYPLYPIFKFFSKEHLTFICKKNGSVW